ncbi:MAG TPA: hypothetical protein VFZ98_01030, partial [Vicinamibacterales bacterium]
MLLLKVTLLLFAALLGGRLMRRRAAASRHLFWSVAFAALLALPMLGMVLPALYLPIPNRWPTLSQSIEPSTPVAAVPVAEPARAPQTAVPAASADAAPAPRSAPARAPADGRKSVTIVLMAVW